jgi:hypothetical protein
MTSSEADLNRETQQRVVYPLAAHRWPGQGKAVIEDRSGKQLLIFSLEFLRTGKVDTFGFILHCISMTFVVENGHICNAEGVMQEPLDRVTAGRFVYWTAGE